MIYFLKQVTDKIKKKQYSIYANLDQVSKHPSHLLELLRSLILKLSLHFVSGLSNTHKNSKTQTKIQ